jgi:hypothetical protein
LLALRLQSGRIMRPCRGKREQPAMSGSCARSDRIRVLEGSLVRAGQGYRASFVCECALLGCTAPISATIEEYETVRGRPNQFLVLPDHVDPELGRVVRKADGFAVVEKLDEQADDV